jgi:hypothetical protein
MTYDGGEEKRRLSRGDEKVGASDDKPVGVYRDTKQKFTDPPMGFTAESLRGDE